ncbi:mitochondrial genome maintenance exonuclease 1 [Eucyclogobius newberryi]|uniref:mitochondrial genome maintenance exonuclease 1 n=1 Tax=Eucyclogobius newberryi TaxID=166745 RepID=UPI003B5C627D
MFAFRNATLVGIIAQMPCCCASHLTVTHLSLCQGLQQAAKRLSPYSAVDTERYSSLVKSVMSRVSSQTPLTIQEEDDHMYGPVIKTPPPITPTRGEERTPKVLHPLFLERSREEDEQEMEPGAGPPTRIHLDRGQGRGAVPSVTRIIQQTMSTEQIFYLERWKRRMVQELGEEGFKAYSQNLFRQGKTFHSALEKTLSSGVKWTDRDPSEMSQFPPEISGYMQSVSHILDDVREVRAIESTVQHHALNYLGIVDCVARYRGVLCVIDWKTSEKPKPFLGNTYDNPIQVAAYAGALNTDANYKYQVENGLIVVAYKDGSPAHAHQLNSELMIDYWKNWLIRLEDFFEKRSAQATNNL